MASRTYTVETRDQAVVIFGGSDNLTSALTLELLSRGIHASKISNLKDLEVLQVNHDPDYLVVFFEPGNKDLIQSDGGELLQKIKSLTQTGESRLIVIRHVSHDLQDFPLPQVSKELVFTDYLGTKDYFSPVLETWLSSIQTSKSLNILGDGLEDLSVMGENDLAQLLAIAILSPSSTREDSILFGNPVPISSLNLAYLVRSNLPYKISLTFDEQVENPNHIFDPTIFQETLDRFNYHLSDSLENNLKSYLKKNFTKEGISMPPDPVPTISPKVTPPSSFVPKNEPVYVPPKVTPSPVIQEKLVLPHKSTRPILSPLQNISHPLKKLTPLRNVQPTFVPLQTRKSKLSIKLPQFSRRAKYSGPPRVGSIIGRGLIIALAIYLGTIAFAITITSLSLKSISVSLRNDELPLTNKLNTFTSTYLQANWVVLTSIPVISKQKSVLDINLLLDAYNQALSVFSAADLLGQSSKEMARYIFGGGDADIAQVVSFSRLQAEELYQKLSLLDGALPVEPPALISEKYSAEYREGKAKLGRLKRSVTTTKALLAVTPELIGLGGRRKYAVLFQNNLELRATGGFIGSFAILSFENGKLYDMPVFDVYDVDGQLKGHVEPPRPIKEILGESNWYLRDSNFDPDFPTTARRVEWFIKKSLNQDLNGTVAVNINTMTSLLKATGPLKIPDYNETVTDTNLSERTQLHSEGNFFPGSTQKKEYLSTVANTIFEQLPLLGENEGLKLIAGLSESIREKNTIISFTNTTADHMFKTLGWNGELSDLPCPTSSNCHKDYAMVVDSNFGVNKANYYVKRDIEEVITLDKNLSVNHVMRLKYQNTATSLAWPSGVYKNYQRLYLPIGTTIGNVKIDGRQLDPKDYALSSEHNKFVIAYIVSVPINSSTLVEVEYNTPQLPQESELLYTWYWQKQPGTSAVDSLTVYFNYPTSLRPTVISPTAEIITQQLKFNMINDSDRRVTVKFSK